jgi:hypothetical protein
MSKLSIKALGLAMGILWGAAMFFLGILNMFSNWGSGIQQAMATLYIGYQPTILGSIIGGIWGFFDCGIAGILLAWLYNKFSV